MTTPTRTPDHAREGSLDTSPAASPDDAFVARLLQAEHVDDAGFTDDVMAALPARKRRWLSRRDVTLGAFVAAAAGAGALAFAHGGLPLDGGATPLQLGSLAVVVVIALWGALASADA